MAFRTLTTVAAATLILAASACGHRAGTAPAALRSESALSARLLPESLTLGGSAGAVSVTTRSEGELVVATIGIDDAESLKAVYLELSYDATNWHAVSVEPLPVLGTLGERLTLGVMSMPGRAYSGQVLVHPDAVSVGLSGDVNVARITLAPGPAPAYRSASDAPVTDLSAAQVTYLPEDDVTGSLEWGYTVQGDYDQNSEVNIADLTPIAQHIGESSGGGPFDYYTIQSVVDGDGNGEINISDITPIGQNFQRRLEEYHLYTDAGAEEYPHFNEDPSEGAPLAVLDYSEGTGDRSQERLRFTHPGVTAADNEQLWVRPADGGHEGTPSAPCVPHPQGAPNITSLDVPASIEAGTTVPVTAVADDPEGDTLTYTWEADQGSFAGSGPSVDYTAPLLGTETQVTLTLTVEDGHGNGDIEQRAVTVIITNLPPVIESINAVPDPVTSEGTSTITAVASDPDGDDLDYTWTCDEGTIFQNAQGDLASFTAPVVTEVQGRVVPVHLKVEDGRGGEANQDYNMLVMAPGAEVLELIELDPSEEPFAGLGTAPDPYVFETGDSIRFRAKSSFGADWTTMPGVTFKFFSPMGTPPGTKFSDDPGEEGLFITNPFFDGSFELWAEDATDSTQRIYLDLDSTPPV